MDPEQLKRIFEYMLERIGGEDNDDVYWYLHDRPKSVNRHDFFQETVWAIWVSGKSRRAADSFLERADAKGFDRNFQTVANWDDQHFSKFVKDLHGWAVSRGRPRSRAVPKGAMDKWEAIWYLAKKLASFPTEEAFRKEFFGGKSSSASLDKTDIRRLVNKHISFVREANAHFIIRNIGGEAIKTERWVDSFLAHFDMSLSELEKQLVEENIPLGLFDIVFYAYCEMFVIKVSAFREHFREACT
ncbi:hypothetical protein M1N44_01025 [Dehalococcoidia bacterium]|nr:hypothetical protein [Dehalococcoidia bacterium]MCL0070348.1 hypothetical protein [Dehalococcoidia bacterium]